MPAVEKARYPLGAVVTFDWLLSKSRGSQMPSLRFRIALIVAPIMLPCWSRGADSTDGRVAVQASIDAREQFAFFRCRFTVTNFDVQDYATVIAGGATPGDTCECIWVVDGKKSKFETRVDPKVWQKALA